MNIKTQYANNKSVKLEDCLSVSVSFIATTPQIKTSKNEQAFNSRTEEIKMSCKLQGVNVRNSE